MLEKIVYYLSGGWERRLCPLLEELKSEGVRSRNLRMKESGIDDSYEILESEEDRRKILFFTDCDEMASLASGQGIACVGVAEPGRGFFRGADLVLESFEGVDLRELEEYLMRFHGFPVTIARTGRLILREMIPEDFDVLYRISRQRGMEQARRDRDGENSFRPERLSDYIRQAYRLYGYGLWSVVRTEQEVPRGKTKVHNARQPGAEGAGNDVRQSGTEGAGNDVRQPGAEDCGNDARQLSPEGGGSDAGQSGPEGAGNDARQPGAEGAGNDVRQSGTEIAGSNVRYSQEGSQIIGCCGFAPVGMEESEFDGYITLTKSLGEWEASEAEEGLVPTLEMEYMLEETCRRQGLGTEMCRAALEYARDRLEVRSVQVRVHPQNLPALRFARSLGFR